MASHPLGRATLLLATFVLAAAAPAAPPVPPLPPPGVDAPLIKPRTGDDLQRASQPLDKIISQYDWPTYLPKPGDAGDKENAADEAAKVDKRIAELKAQLEKKKDGDAAAELVRLLVIHKDDAVAAAPYAAQVNDAKWRLNTPLAAKATDQLSVTDLLDLGIWYRELAMMESGARRVRLFQRALEAFDAALKRSINDDKLAAVANASKAGRDKVKADLAVGGDEKPAELPLHVQRTYARARAAWREGQPRAAINLLEAANNLSPNQPEILRTLGLIYFNDLGNPVQGAQYLKRAIKLAPNDLDALFLLARHELLNLRQPRSAIVIFSHARSVKDAGADPAIPLLIHHYLGRSLQLEDYDAAAVAEYEKFLDLAGRFARNTRYYQEVALYTRQIPTTLQQVGDAHNRLNKPAEAIKAYERALEEKSDDSLALVSRIAYTRLLLNDGDGALAAVVGLIKSTSGDASSLALLKYLVDAGAKADKLAGELKRIYGELDQPTALALALANLQGGQAGLATLREHLKKRPEDREVFQRLLELHLATGNPADAVEAVRVTAQSISDLPAAAERYAGLLLDAAGKPDAVITAIEALPAAEQATGVVRVLRAMALLRAGRDDEAIEALARAVEADKSLTLMQASLVKLLVDRKDYDRAAKVLKSLPDLNDPKIVPLRIRVLRETNKLEEAMTLLNSLLADQKHNPDLVLEKAKLQLQSNDDLGAQRTLELGIDSNPNAEPLYEMLFDLYDQAQTIEAERASIKLAEKVIRSMPLSKLARTKQAEFLIRKRDVEAAEKLLRSVQKEYPTDKRSLNLLVSILHFTERQGEAEAIIEARLKDFPKEPAVLEAALDHFRNRVRNEDRWYELAVQYTTVVLTGTARDLQLAMLHLRNNHPERAVELLVKALEDKAKIDEPDDIARLLGRAMLKSGQADKIDDQFKKLAEAYPKKWADLTFEWAMLNEIQGRKEQSEKLLLQVIEKEPKHPKANNALGYSWADKGKNLQKAEQMIKLALDDDPDSAAYLDSMGWVKYKQGQFDEAVKWLERARLEEGGDHAVILDHLADALYRAGRQVEALQWWMKAQSTINPKELDDDPELKGVAASLRLKISAVRTAKEPPTAEVPKKEEEKKNEEKKEDEPNK